MHRSPGYRSAEKAGAVDCRTGLLLLRGQIFDIALSGDSVNQALADKMPKVALRYILA